MLERHYQGSHMRAGSGVDGAVQIKNDDLCIRSTGYRVIYRLPDGRLREADPDGPWATHGKPTWFPDWDDERFFKKLRERS